MKIFLSKKDSETKVAIIGEKDDKIQVKFLNGMKKGETTTYSASTLKRWWKEIEEDTTVEEKSNKKEAKRKTINRDDVVKKLSETLGIDFIQYPSTPGLYKPDTTPATFYLGVTRSHISVYIKNRETIKISYNEDYVAKVVEILTKNQ